MLWTPSLHVFQSAEETYMNHSELLVFNDGNGGSDQPGDGPGDVNEPFPPISARLWLDTADPNLQTHQHVVPGLQPEHLCPCFCIYPHQHGHTKG